MRFTPTTYALAYLDSTRGSTPVELKGITSRFWAAVWRHRRWGWRRKIIDQVIKLRREQAGVIGVELSVAKPFTDSATQKFQRELTKALGQAVELTVTLKPHLLAGVVLTVGDRRYDASLKGRLDNLYHALAGTEQQL